MLLIRAAGLNCQVGHKCAIAVGPLSQIAEPDGIVQLLSQDCQVLWPSWTRSVGTAELGCWVGLLSHSDLYKNVLNMNQTNSIFMASTTDSKIRNIIDHIQNVEHHLVACQELLPPSW